MKDTGVIICEHEPGCRLPEEINGFVITKSKNTAKPHLHSTENNRRKTRNKI